jgi:hypothetical protein
MRGEKETGNAIVFIKENIASGSGRLLTTGRAVPITVLTPFRQHCRENGAGRGAAPPNRILYSETPHFSIVIL